MNRRNMLITFLVLLALAVILPMFSITLPFGNPNLGTTPVTLAGVFLPWYLGLITGLAKGLSAAAFTGRWITEIPAGVGDAVSACFTFWLARSMHKTIAAILGQLSRYIFTSGVIALTISISLAAGLISLSQAPVSGLTGSFLTNLAVTWGSISYPSITISIMFNLVVSVLVILVCGRYVDNFLLGPKEDAGK
jgi:hypothetical protein